MGILIFLFIFWKRLKEDYAAEVIFQVASFVLIGIGVGWAFSAKFFPGWFFWSDTIGAMIGLTLAILRFKLKFYETLEALIISGLPWLGLIFLKNSVLSASLSSFLAFAVILVMVFVSYYFDVHYKRFTWYKSGRIGFAGLAVAILFFLTRSVLAIGKVTVLSFAGRAEGIASGVMVFICCLLLYNLGRNK